MPLITLAPDGLDYLEWRPGSARTVEIFDIAVRTDRRRGRGRQLVERLLTVIRVGHESDSAAPTLVYAITRMTNVIAHEFYEALGFRTVGRLHDFYRDGGKPDRHALVYGLDL